MNSEPIDPIQAVVHPNPYRYYARLREGSGLSFDSRLRLWIASTAEVVSMVLEHPDCRVRSASEPVPKAIAEGAAGDVFARLMRMNDGESHRCPKHSMQQALSGIAQAEVAKRTQAQIDRLKHDLCSPAGLSRWILELPVSVMADLLGFSRQRLPEIAAWTGDFIAYLSPLSDARRLESSHSAARYLMQEFRALWLDDPAPETPVLQRIRQGAIEQGWGDQEAILANLVGLLSQTYEATAGLIGNAIVTLCRRPELQDELHQRPALVKETIAEVDRFDPPVHNTRRFVTQPLRLGGAVLETGDTILVLLASANRDPLANEHPDEFITQRRERRTFGFGHGHHCCPGHALAITIATTAVQSLLQTQPEMSANRWVWQYRPSVNGRIPEFHNR